MNSEELQKLLCCPADISALRRIASQHAILRWFVNASVARGISNHLGLHLWKEQCLLPFEPGCAGVPVTLTPLASAMPCADSAAILPIKWSLTAARKLALPTSLLQIADEVLQAARRSPIIREQYGARIDQPWQLNWAIPEWRDVQFHDLPLKAESAFAPLTLGLLSAASGLPLAQNFIATGEYRKHAWHVNGQTLQDKFLMAIRLGFRRFAAPQSAKAAFDAALSEGMQMLDVDERALLQQAPLINSEDVGAGTQLAKQIAGVRPERKASEESREVWYDSIRDNGSAWQYYQDCLLEDAANKALSRLEEQHRHWRPHTVVSIVSNSDELLQLAALVFQPVRCVLIYTDDEAGHMQRRFARLQEWAGARETGPEVEPVVVHDNCLSLGEIVAAIQSLPRQPGEDSGILIDTTPGRRAMQMAALQGACAGDRILCWWNDTSPHSRRARPFSVRPLLWRARTSSALQPLTAVPSSALEMV